MSLTAAKYETLTRLLTALSQRQDTIRQLATQLATGNIWRSPDGSVSVEFTTAQLEQMEKIITDYLGESEAIVAASRALLEKP